MKPGLLVLAAGMGSRYGGLKQLDPVGPGGETIIDYSVYDALRAGFGKVVFVIRRDIEEPFRRTVGARFEGRAPVRYAFQELSALPEGFSVPAGRTKPWGTGHAVLSATGELTEPFAVINADDFYGAASFQLMAEHLKAGREHGMVGFSLRNTLSPHGSVSRGVCDVAPDGCLRDVVERVDIRPEGEGAVFTEPGGAGGRLTGDETVSMNMWGFLPSIFGHLRSGFSAFLSERGSEPKAEFYLPLVVGLLARGNGERIRVLRTPDRWFGVTYKQDLPAVRAAVSDLVARRTYPERLWA